LAFRLAKKHRGFFSEAVLAALKCRSEKTPGKRKFNDSATAVTTIKLVMDLLVFHHVSNVK